MVYGLRNKFRVHMLREKPVYTKEDLDKIASGHMSILPSFLRKESDMYRWLAVYKTFLKAGLSSQEASEETDNRILWYD